MYRTWMKRSWIPALMVAVGLTACETSPGPLGVSAGPEHSRSSAAAHAGKVRGSVPASVKVLSVSRLIGAQGGSLEHGGHLLVVPAGAVAEPTVFRMRLLKEGYVEVDLHATGTGARAGEDVGERGFARPVTLRLSYANATDAVETERVSVVWVREDGTLERVGAAVDAAGRTVTASLDHFSRYALAMD